MYLQDLLRDRVQLESMPKGLFSRLSAVLDAEIESVRKQLFSNDSKTLIRKFPESNSSNNNHNNAIISSNAILNKNISSSTQNNNSDKISLPVPNPNEKISKKQRKIFMPIDKYPTFNFVGRIVGPRGRTIKEIEHKTGVKLLVRGRGSMRNSQVEEMKRGKPNYEHLSETLHVILQCEDGETRSRVKLDAAEDEIRKLINPELENGRDDIKKKQLTELAILNGTYNPCGPVKQVSPTFLNAGSVGIVTAQNIIPQQINQLNQPTAAATQVFVDPNTNQIYRAPVIYTQDAANCAPQFTAPMAYQYVQTTQHQQQQQQLQPQQQQPQQNNNVSNSSSTSSSGGGKVQSMRMIQKNTITHSPY